MDEATFYTTGIMEDKYLNRFLYRGRGRPRKQDYSSLSVLQNELNRLIACQIKAQMLLSNSKVEE